ncbi:hypothetical protein SODALDRAFT_353499 [Sodiomyces alkalinus F11]|uniref:Uncharacterized protein n=1 Tax=Sodiomyces alkalinus (strain CBS 110278 / VKM F-3762 / F11) TaxID=1314773 RepID=A0A3N2PKP8_SODAK|nr:hypothetical protein SODALDRAFT_353499 [Sodiomyces alkalinus F11]ROT35101.1 hypothetical protein SODALDRAFT_353499 [Sodiomyces alkalinus F11]
MSSSGTCSCRMFSAVALDVPDLGPSCAGGFGSMATMGETDASPWARVRLRAPRPRRAAVSRASSLGVDLAGPLRAIGTCGVLSLTTPYLGCHCNMFAGKGLKVVRWKLDKYLTLRVTPRGNRSMVTAFQTLNLVVQEACGGVDPKTLWYETCY